MAAVSDQTDTGVADAAGGKTDARKSGRRKAPIFLLKIVVTLGLCSWIVYQVDWQQFWQQLLSLSLWVIGLLVALRVAAFYLSALKWQQLLAAHDVRYRLVRLFRWYVISAFFSQFLPSTIGGDGYKVLKTYRNPRGRAAAVLAVFVERATGLLALLLIGYAAAIVSFWRTGNELSEAVVWIGSAGLAASVIGAAVVVRGGLLGRVAQWRFCPSPARSLIRFSGDYRHHPWKVTAAVLISFLFHLVKIAVMWFLLWVLGATTRFDAVAVAITLSTLAGMIPISFAGWGLIEGSFMGTMSAYGLDPTTSLIAMMVTRLVTVPVTLTGGALYFLESVSKRSASSQATTRA